MVKRNRNGQGYLRATANRTVSTVDIINPTVERGRPPRDLTRKDVISAPVKLRGTFRVLDILSNESALAVMAVYNRSNAKAA
jgi:hypothetical protein